MRTFKSAGVFNQSAVDWEQIGEPLRVKGFRFGNLPKVSGSSSGVRNVSCPELLTDWDYIGIGKLVQSLNSPFFPPHTGAESGRAKRESRITCMRMLRTNQSKITRPLSTRVHTPVNTFNMSRNAFFSSCSEKKFFDVDIVVKNKLKCGLSLSVLLSTTSTRHCCFPDLFCIVSACWASLQKSDAYKKVICIMRRMHF